MIAGDLSYSEAVEKCSGGEGGEAVLGYPTDSSDFEFFMTLGLGENYWLGANDNKKEGAWIDSDGKFYKK